MRDSDFTLRDLLYLDFDKAASIWSQFEEGLLESLSVTEDTGKDRAAGTRFGLKFGVAGLADAQAEANLGVDYIQKRSTLQSKTLHHDVLTRVEARLEQSGLVTDLSSLPANESSAEQIRAAFGDRPYLRAQGWSFIEDYQKMLTISAQLNPLIEFGLKCSQDAIKKSPEYVQLQQLLLDAKREIEQSKDRNEKTALRAQLKEAQNTVDQMTKVEGDQIQEWLIKGLRLLIETFMPTRINFRIYPFPQCPSFQVLCNLKRECFVDSDLEHLLYGYGNQPNVPLAVFGLITSLPAEGGAQFEPLSEFKDPSQLVPEQVFENAFRQVFVGIGGVDRFVRFSRYPNVTVHPIAVYRSFQIKGKK